MWWDDHYKKTFGPRRIGPYEVKKKLSDLSFELKEIDGGPKMGRRYPIVNGRDLSLYECKREFVVEEIMSHQGLASDPKDLEFKVRWIDGDITWEPIQNLYDVIPNGWIIYNDELLKYAQVWKLKLPKRKKGDVVK